MKGFVFASVILVLLCALIFTDTYIVADRLCELEDLCSHLPDDPNDALSQCITIKEKWDSSAVILELSVNKNELEAVYSKLSVLISYCRSGADAEYRAAASALTDAIGDLRRSEELSFRGIF